MKTESYIFWKYLKWSVGLCKCLPSSSLPLPVFSLFFSPDSHFIPSYQHFIPLANSPPFVFLPNFLLPTLCPCFFFHFSSFVLHPRQAISPPSVLSCDLFLPFFPSLFSAPPFLPADGHMQRCKWQAAVWLWCGRTVVCLHCHCGSFCLPACCFTLSGPGWLLGRLAGWLADWMTDWLLHNWGGSVNVANTQTHAHYQYHKPAINYPYWRHRPAISVPLLLCSHLNTPCCLNTQYDKTTKHYLSSDNCHLQKVSQW